MAHTFIEAEKAQGLQSASWRTRRAEGVVSVQVQGPDNQVNQPKSESEGRKRPSLKTVRQKEQILSYFSFWSIEAFSGLAKAGPHWGGQSVLLSLLTQMLKSETFSQSHQNNV